MNSLSACRHTIAQNANYRTAKVLARFFKTEKGEYGEGDIFLGITVPNLRKIAQEYCTLFLRDIKILLLSKIHEERLIALLILVHNFINGNAQKRRQIYNFYLKSTKYINNWDLVDLSADKIIGEYLRNNPRTILTKLARSKNLWERRIAIVATFQLIKHNEFSETLRIARILRNDTHDLIRKAVGWMLREVGKRSQKTEERFLKKYCAHMPRTMLRYAIEKFSEKQKYVYLSKNHTFAPARRKR